MQDTIPQIDLRELLGPSAEEVRARRIWDRVWKYAVRPALVLGAAYWIFRMAAAVLATVQAAALIQANEAPDMPLSLVWVYATWRILPQRYETADRDPAAISFGMYTGLLPAQLALAGKALGLTKVMADLVTGAGSVLAPENAIRKQDLFFLWKVRQLSQGRRRLARSAT